MAAALLAALVESSNDAVASKTLDGIVTSWNSAAERLFGYTAAEMIGQPIAVLSTPERQAEMPMILERVRRGERLESFDTTRRRKDGSVVEISLTVSPIYDAAGRIVGASKIARDISERRAAERQQQLLLGELDHRVRNTLMVVLGLTSQTLSAGPEREALLGRLHAIAHGQALLSAPNTRPVRIRELITAELAPYEHHVAVGGTDVELRPKAVTVLSLAIHELATNAAKHGALSALGGRVTVRWQVEPGGHEGDVLRLSWSESGGPPVAIPKRQGYGRTLLETAPYLSLKAVITMDFKPEGLVYTLAAPLSGMGAVFRPQ